MIDINIVLVNYKCRDDILKAVDSVKSDLKNTQVTFQITVVDNSNNVDGLETELKNRHLGVKYINPGKNIGFGAANNLGFQSIAARYYFALNRDVFILPDSGTIKGLIRYMDQNQYVGCIGPKLLNTDGSVQNSCYRFDLPSIAIKPLKQLNWQSKYKRVKKHVDKLDMVDFDHNSTRPVDWVLGAALLIRQQVVNEVGWFDEKYFMYMEDCDWCRRIWEAGWPVYYLHNIRIEHGHARESAKVPGIIRALAKNKLARIHLASWIKYLIKWRGKHKYFAYVS